MFDKTITVFNYYKSRLGDMWYPSVVRNVQLTVDKSAIMAKFGAESKDNAMLNIHYENVSDNVFVDGKPYISPKKWENQTNDKLSETITFKEYDFFILGEYADLNPVNDEDYDDGFYNYMNTQFDDVYTITSVGMYSVIPSFQIMGA